MRSARSIVEASIILTGLAVCSMAARAQQLPAARSAEAAPVQAQQPPVSPSAEAATSSSSQAKKPQQQAAPKNVKDCPPQSSQPTNPCSPANDRIFKVVPNYFTVEGEDAAERAPSISSAEKFKLAAQDTFDPFSFASTGFYATVAQVQHQERSWGGGVGGFTKRYSSAFADMAISNMVSMAAMPSLIHEDPRYFTLGHGGFLKRAAYAISRIVVTRTDAGTNRFNFSEIFGNAAASAISINYYPRSERTLKVAENKWAGQIGGDAVFNVLKEFWPDMRRYLHISPKGEKVPAAGD